MVVRLLIFSFACTGLVCGQTQETAADLAEKQNQAALHEKTRQMELEMVRAERKGAGAVYELWKERTAQQAERANKSRSSSDVLIFERMLSSTLEALSCFIDKRGFTYRLPSNNPNFAGQEVPKSYMMDEEARKLEHLLDESLRDPKK